MNSCMRLARLHIRIPMQRVLHPVMHGMEQNCLMACNRMWCAWIAGMRSAGCGAGRMTHRVDVTLAQIPGCKGISRSACESLALRAGYQKPATAAPSGHGDVRNLRLNVVSSTWVVGRAVTLRSLKPCKPGWFCIHMRGQKETAQEAPVGRRRSIMVG